jgi:predicted transcriptional regulator
MAFPAHKPTIASRAEVSALLSFGVTHDQIADYMSMSPTTLRKHYADELRTASISANAQVARCLFKKAVEQDDLTAQIFWLKTKARWRTDETLQLSDQNDKLQSELKTLREQLDAQNKKDF